jgi:hypothetical protein
LQLERQVLFHVVIGRQQLGEVVNLRLLVGFDFVANLFRCFVEYGTIKLNISEPHQFGGMILQFVVVLCDLLVGLVKSYSQVQKLLV